MLTRKKRSLKVNGIWIVDGLSGRGVVVVLGHLPLFRAAAFFLDHDGDYEVVTISLH